MKKIFTCLIALVLGMSMSWAQTILLTEEQETMLHAQRAPQATTEVAIDGWCYMADLRSNGGIIQFTGWKGDRKYLVALPTSTTIQGNYSSILTAYSNIKSADGNTKHVDFTSGSVKVTSKGNNIYDFDGTVKGNDGKTYHITMRFQYIFDIDDPTSCNFTNMSITEFSHQTSNVYKLNLANTQTMESVNLYCISNTNYLTSGIYNIDYSGSVGTIKAADGNLTSTPDPTVGTLYNATSTNFKKIEVSSSGYKTNYNFRFWFPHDGTVVVINPNHDNVPKYVKVSGTNTYFNTSVIPFTTYSVTATAGTIPALRKVTLASASNGNTATMTCAEGHGYPSGGVEAGMEGDYYYQGTKLTLTATPATGYRFVRWKNGSSQLSTNATYEYTVGSSNVTITPEFELQKFTVTIAKDPSTYGTVSQSSVANVPYGTVITTDNNTVTINGTTVTATPNTATAQYTYAFDSWTNETATVTGPTTVTANFSRTTNTYAVSIVSNNADYGTVDVASVTNVPYGTVITTDNNTVTINGTTVTATPTTATAQYTYAFDSWTNGTATVTDATTVTANFSRTLNQYTVTINDPEHGTLTVKNNETLIASGTKVDYGTTLTVTYQADGGYHFDAWTNAGAASVTIDGDKTIGVTFAPNVHTLTWAGIDGATLSGDYTAAGDVAYGTTLVAPEVEKAGFNFLGWDPTFVESTTMPDNDVTYTAQWEEASTFTLEDQYNEDEPYYTTLAGFAESGSTKDVTYARTFQGGTADAPYWNVFSLPFDYMLAGSSHSFAGKVLELSSASYDAVNDEVTLNFLYETYQIEANKPYALINKGGDIVNPEFENVTFKTLGENRYSVPCTTGGEVTFVNTTCRQKMDEGNRNILFIGNNQLLYPGEEAYLRAFRGYFWLENVLPQNAAPKRVRLMIEGESVATGLSTEFAPEVQSAKRIENGVLIIERNGNRYDAQGKEMK